MLRKTIIIIFCSIFILSAARAEHYPFLYEPLQQMEMGAVDVVSANQLLYRGYNSVFESTGWNNGLPGRGLNFALMWGLPDFTIFSHEYFGHGARVREFNGKATYSYSFWGEPDQGSYCSWEGQNAASLDQQMSFAAGGVEATQLIGLETEKRIYRRGTVRPDDFRSLQNMNGDLLGRLSPSDPSTVSDYILWLTRFMQKYQGSQAVTPLYLDYYSKIENETQTTAWSNPAYYWAGLAVIKFIVWGDRETTAPTLNVYGLNFGWSPRYILTPIGPDTYNYFFIRQGDILHTVYVRRGEFPGGNFSGWGIETGPYTWRGAGLTAGLDKWEQPGSDGTNLSLGLQFFINDHFGLMYNFENKTEGYLIGRPFAGGTTNSFGVVIGF